MAAKNTRKASWERERPELAPNHDGTCLVFSSQGRQGALRAAASAILTGQQGSLDMRRAWMFAGAAGLAVTASFLALWASRSLAEGKKGEEKAPVQAEATLAKLHIGQVVLFSSGVGYFQR